MLTKALRPCRPSSRAQIYCFLSPSRFFTSSNAVLQHRRKRRSAFIPSSEQLKVAKLCLTQNVIVTARPGSGKTATAEAIAASSGSRILVLTYSKQLQRETHGRLRDYPNCTVLTFHAMAGLYLKRIIFNDADLVEERRRILSCKKLPQLDFGPFDIIILDEYQDCTDILFWLTNCFIQANKRANKGQPARIVVLGDERQSIYQFRGASSRYLTLAPEIFGLASPYSFTHVPLSSSFRLPGPSTRFINNAFLGGEPYINSVKPGPKPIVLRRNPFQYQRLAKRLIPLIKHYGAKNSAIIAPSTRRPEQLKRLVNTLSKDYKIPIHVPVEDEFTVNDKVVNGKLFVSTIHQFKGSERDLVILFGMDDSYFRYYGRNLSDHSCPNEVFVALTRARDQLVLVHNDEEKLMPFVSVDAVFQTAEVENMTDKEMDIAPPSNPSRDVTYGLFIPGSVSATEMTRYLQDSSLRDIVQRDLCIKQLSPPLPESDHIEISNVVSSDKKRNLYEAVSDINGLVVVAAFEHGTFGTLKTLGVEDKGIIGSLPPTGSDDYIPWLCRQACTYESQVSGYMPRINQMKSHPFDWIAPKDLSLARSRLEKEVEVQAAQHLEFEASCSRTLNIADKEVTVNGRADVIAASSSAGGFRNQDVDTIWEIKFVSRLSDENFVQAAIYTYLFAKPDSGRLPRTILYNVRDGNKWEISARNGEAGLLRMVESILRLRYTTTEELSHEGFIDLCRKTMKEVMDLS